MAPKKTYRDIHMDILRPSVVPEKRRTEVICGNLNVHVGNTL